MIEICKSHGREMGGPWECYDADNFFGWEAERVVVVTAGNHVLETATRAKRELILIIAEPEMGKEYYQKIQEIVAAGEGLVDLEVVESVNQDGEKKMPTTEAELEAIIQERIEKVLPAQLTELMALERDKALQLK